MGSRPRTSSACSSPSRRSPRLRSPHLLRRPLRQSLRRTPMPRRRRRRRRRRPSKLAVFLYFYAKTLVALEKASNFENSTFQIRNGRYEGGDRPSSNNIVSWYLTLTDISFIKNSQFTNKDILLWGKKKKKKKKKVLSLIPLL